MADIVGGNAYVDTVAGTNDTSHGTSAGAGACLTLKYLVESRLGTLTSACTVYCVGATADTLAASITFDGISTAAYKLTVKGDRWSYTTDGMWNTGYYRIGGTFDNDLINLTQLNVEFDGIQFDMACNGSADRAIDVLDAGAPTVLALKNCIIRRNGAAQASMFGINAGDPYDGSSIYLYNCIIYGFIGSGNAGVLLHAASIVYAYNCVFHDNTVAIDNPSAIVKNTIFEANTSDQGTSHPWNAASDYNSTTVNAAFDPAGTYSHINCTDFNFADLTNHDFRLTAASGDPHTRNSGVTIAACSPDPLGTTRPTETNYSRGAFEYIAAGGRTAMITRSKPLGVMAGMNFGVQRCKP